MGDTGIEPVTPTVSRWCSTSELIALAEDVRFELTVPFPTQRFSKPSLSTTQPIFQGASCEIRTHDRRHRNPVL